MKKGLALKTANNRCPFLPDWLALPISNEQALDILLKKGYKIVEIDFVSLARSCVGFSKYEWHHHPNDAPAYVDCASFVRWIYSHCGIWLPRYSIQQRELGSSINLGKHLRGDLIFSQGAYGKFWKDPKDKVGHVGMITDQNRVIHAAGSKLGVVETTIEAFASHERLRGIKRICNLNQTTILQVRPKRLIETLDDLRWDILNTQGR